MNIVRKIRGKTTETIPIEEIVSKLDEFDKQYVTQPHNWWAKAALSIRLLAASHAGLESELTRLQEELAAKSGHSEDCGGIDPDRNMCDCGYLQGR